MMKDHEEITDAIVQVCEDLHAGKLDMIRAKWPAETIFKTQQAITAVENLLWNIKKNEVDIRLREE